MSNPSREETRRRAELVAGISILERFGVIDFNGHFSARLPDGRVLINNGASVRSAIAPEDFVAVETDGATAEGEARPPAELPLHLAVYRERPEVNAVVHGHPEWSTLLSSAGHAYEVTMPQGALLGDVQTYESPESANNQDTAGGIVAALGDGRAALMRAHGSVVAGTDVLEATVLAIYLELNVERQVRAAPLGGAYVFSPEQAQACREGLWKRGLFEKCWNYYLAKYGLERPV